WRPRLVRSRSASSFEPSTVDGGVPWSNVTTWASQHSAVPAAVGAGEKSTPVVVVCSSRFQNCRPTGEHDEPPLALVNSTSNGFHEVVLLRYRFGLST